MSEITEKSSLWRVPNWFSELSQETLDKLKSFNDEILRVNKTLDVISMKTQPLLDVIHFADCIIASRMIREDLKNSEPIYDIGSGGGFPGIVFSILYPDLNVRLIDSNSKKCEFLNHISDLLFLKSLKVENLPIESLPENKVVNCMTRGFGSITKSLMATRKVVKAGGSFYQFKGEEWGLEVADIPTQLCSFWNPVLVGEYHLPIGETKLSIVKMEKKK